MNPQMDVQPSRRRVHPRSQGVPISEYPPDGSNKVCLKCGLVFPVHRLKRYRDTHPTLKLDLIRYICMDCINNLHPDDLKRVLKPVTRRKKVYKRKIPNPRALDAAPDLRAARTRSVSEILAVHREALEDDPNRLSTEFILSLTANHTPDDLSDD